MRSAAIMCIVIMTELFLLLVYMRITRHKLSLDINDVIC